MPNEDLSQLKIDKSASKLRPVRGRRKIYWGAACLFVILALILFFSGVLRPAVTVETVTVQKTFPSLGFTVLNASGYVVAQRKAAVSSKATGRLVWLGVEEGTRVRKGEVIARLESDDVVATRSQAEANLNVSRASLQQARAELRDAGLSFNRIKVLYSQGILAKADYDTADARYRKAVAAVSGAEAGIRASGSALDAARVGVEFTQIRAPFDAVVLTKNADVGNIITPLAAAADAKAAVVTIADLGSLLVEVDVSESNLQLVKADQPCEIQLDALPDSRFRGKVHIIVPTADRSKATVLVKVRFIDTDRRILPEMSAKVAFLTRQTLEGEQKPRTTVNIAAVAERRKKKLVFLVKDTRVVESPVTLGARFGDQVEVVSGVKAGDKVVVRPGDDLRDGSRIKLAEK